VDDNNPYQSPVDSEPPPSPVGPHGRWVFLLLPPSIPPIVHAVARMFLSPKEDVAHMLLLLVAVGISWGWNATMLDRLGLSFWRQYFLGVAVWGAVVASALFTVAMGLRH
jgi:hypothetical protein